MSTIPTLHPAFRSAKEHATPPASPPMITHAPPSTPTLEASEDSNETLLSHGPDVAAAAAADTAATAPQPVRLASLQGTPRLIKCPACGAQEISVATSKLDEHKHFIGLAFLPCSCIPYIGHALKDVDHRCARCRRLLARWNFRGSTEVLYGTEVGLTDEEKTRRKEVKWKLRED